MAYRNGTYVAFHAGGKTSGIRLLRDQPDGAGECAGSVQRALRAAQDLHAIQVVDVERQEQRRLTDVGGHRRDGVGRRIVGRVGIDAAQHEVAAAGGTLVHEGNTGDHLGQVGQGLNVILLEVRAGDGRDAVRDVEHRGIAAGGGDHHFGQSVLLRVGGNRQHGREHGRAGSCKQRTTYRQGQRMRTCLVRCSW